MMAYGRGDTVAFETLYLRHRGPLFRFFVGSAPSRAEAEDLFQECWGRVISARERYRPEAKFSTWLLQIAHNLLTDRFRRQKPVVGGEDGEALLAAIESAPQERPDRRLSEFEQARTLRRALAALPDDQREAFLLRAEHGMGVEEIAEATGVGRETAKSRLRYAMSKLKEWVTP